MSDLTKNKGVKYDEARKFENHTYIYRDSGIVGVATKLNPYATATAVLQARSSAYEPERTTT